LTGADEDEPEGKHRAPEDGTICSPADVLANLAVYFILQLCT